MGTPRHTDQIRKPDHSGTRGVLHETEAVVIVAIVGVVPVTVSRTKVVRFVVPGAATQHTAPFRPIPVRKIVQKTIPKVNIALCTLLYPAPHLLTQCNQLQTAKLITFAVY